MRKKDIFFDRFYEIMILERYLYAHSEHSVVIENAIHISLEISIDSNGNFLMKNLNYPDFEAQLWTPKNSELFAMIKQLKEQPATTHAELFQNKWEEIIGYERMDRMNNHRQLI